jgi:hypothetical protein
MPGARMGHTLQRSVPSDAVFGTGIVLDSTLGLLVCLAAIISKAKSAAKLELGYTQRVILRVERSTNLGAPRGCKGGTMLTRIVTTLLSLICFAFLCTAVVAQQTPASGLPSADLAIPPTPVRALEFPMILEENIVAGKTAAGTAVQGKLVTATLLNGVVVPKNAVFSGVVTESVEKSKAEPSRLGIRLDTVQWKGQTTQIRVYLSPWYYPSVQESGAQDLQYGPTQSAKATWNGQGQYPSQNSKIYEPFPGRDSGQGSAVPDTPVPVTSSRRVAMKNVESSLDSSGAVTITSKHSNLKLDKLTTYVFASGDLLPPAK